MPSRTAFRMYCIATFLLLLVSSSYGFSSEPPTTTASSWQRRLDRALLDIDIEPEARFRNFQRALKDPNLLTDVRSAVDTIREKGFGKGHPELINKLWPVGTLARADIEGLAALTKQVPETFEEIRDQLPELIKAQQQSQFPPKADRSLEMGSIPKPEEIEEEIKNAFRSIPKGLETPDYSVERVLDGEVKLGSPEKIEIRKYEAFTVATTPSIGGAGFNTLASYLFGSNEEKQSMAMTMPVIITNDKNSDETTELMGTMKFVIPSVSSEAPPTPLKSDDVNIERIPERLVAVKVFPGLVTKEEVSRQKKSLLSSLSGEGVGLNVMNEEEISVLQYNSPFTIPWRRRNEIAIVVAVSDDDKNEINIANLSDIAESTSDIGAEDVTV